MRAGVVRPFAASLVSEDLATDRTEGTARDARLVLGSR